MTARDEQDRGLASAVARSLESRAALRADGRDPTHGGEAGRTRGRKHVERMREARAYDLANGELPKS